MPVIAKKIFISDSYNNALTERQMYSIKKQNGCKARQNGPESGKKNRRQRFSN